MKNFLMFAAAVLLVGCGGASEEAVTAATASPTDMNRYLTSEPLLDNSNSSAYKVLLMGNSHAAGLRPILERILVLGQPDKLVDVQLVPGNAFLAERVNDGVSAQELESEQWTHVIFQARENSCVAPVGLVWDEVLFRNPSLLLHEPDGNHASNTGALLTALVFYQIITGQSVESLSGLSEFNIDSVTEQVMKESVSSLLFVYTPCDYEA